MYNTVIIFIWKIISFFSSNNQEEDIPAVVFRLLKFYGIKLSFTTTREYLKSNPDYPALKSICDFLEDYRIAYYPLKLNISDLYNLDRPFICHIKERCGKVLLVYSLNKNKVIYTDTPHGLKSMSLSDFLEKWKGVVILIEPSELIVELDYTGKRNDEIVRQALVPFIFLILCFVIFASIYSLYTPPELIYISNKILISLIHFVGFIFSVLLFRHELEIKTQFTEKLCHISTNSDCNVVTKSKVSKIFGNITWADAGIVYFLGGMIILFVFPDKNTIALLSLLSICSLPYPIFSIIYQWLKLRKWCPMCLSVQLILLIEFIILIPGLRPLYLDFSDLIAILLIYSVILLIIIQMKLLIISEKEKDNYKLNLLKLKRNQELFFHQLQTVERINFPIDNDSLILGDLKSEVTIVIFLSPYCSACATKFNESLNLIRNKIKVKIHFVLSPFEDELSIKLLKIIYPLIKSNERTKAIEFLENWYLIDEKLRNRKFRGITIPKSLEGFDKMISYNKSLFKIGNIKKVPNVFVNGYPLPAIYSLEDIRYHTNNLLNMNKESI